MLCQDGLHLLRQCIHLIVGLGTHQIEEYRGHAAQQVVITFSVFFCVYDSIVESRLFRIIDGLLNLFIITADTLHESLFVVLQTDTVEGHGIMRCLVILEKGVYANFIVVHIAIFNPLL